MQNVLILSAGRRVELVLAFAAELRKNLPHAKLLAADANPRLAAACYRADQALSLPRADALGYSDALLEACSRHGIGLVVPTIDTELLVLAQQRRRFAQQGIHLVVSDTKLVQLCRDKRLLANYLQSMGWRVPERYPRDAIRFPCFVKPYDGSRSLGAQRVQSALELSEAMRADPKLLFMELVDPEYDEYTVDAYYDRHGALRCLVPRQRLEVRGGEVSKSITRKGALYSYLKAKLSAIEGAIGCITIQLFADTGAKNCIMSEINARFGGGYPLSYSAGANYPAWLLGEYLQNKQLQDFEAWEADLLMLRYDQQVLVHAD